jgi:hypothetical protein
MAKTKISEWSTTPASNTDIDGINIAEGCAPSGINDAIRDLMSQVRSWYGGTTGDTLAVAGGGTGAGTLTGVIKGNGTSAFTAATAGTDYTSPSSTETMTNKTLTNPTVNNYTEGVVAIGTVTSSNTIALTNGTVQTATLTASTACTFTMPTATAGKSFVLLLKQAATTGNGTATFTGVKWGTTGAPTITATAGKMDILTFVADGTNWYGSVAQGYTP